MFRMFSNQFEESAHSIITVRGVEQASLSSLVNFMYTGQLKVTVETAPSLLVAADLFLMAKVKDSLCEFLQKTMCAASCVYLTR